MRTNSEMSELWQFAHLKFHFGEELAKHAMDMPENVAYNARSAEDARRDRDSPGKTRKEAAGIKASAPSRGIA